MKYLLPILVMMLSCSIIGQTSSESNKYLSDFDFFIDKLIEIHPDPYSAFGSQIEFYKAKQNCREEVKQVANDKVFVAKINQFISPLEDGHTYISLRKSSVNNEKYLPVQLKVSGDYLFIQSATGEFAKNIGKAITAVNDIPMNNLLQKVKKIRASENISGTYNNLISMLQQRSSVKQLLDETDAISLSFKGEKEAIEVPYQPKVEWVKRESNLKMENNNGLLLREMIGRKKDIGYLAWNSVISREYIEWVNANQTKYINDQLSWAYSHMTHQRTGKVEKDIQQIPSLYEEFYLLLKEMKKKNSKYVIIDLRKNGGGMTPLIEPLLYLMHGDQYLSFDFKAEYIKKISLDYLKKFGFENIEALNKAWYADYKVGDYKFDDSFGNYKSYLPLEERRKSIEKGYQGFGGEFVKKAAQLGYMPSKIIVLTSPNTFSAAYHFTYFLKRLGKTKLIGVASRQAGNSFMETTNFELPETKLSGSISNGKQVLFKDDLEQGKLLRPDIEMQWSDYQKYGFDENAELLKAIDFIELN